MGWEDGITFIAGMLLGMLSGLLPGIHSNTIVSVIAGLGVEPEMAAIMIIAMFPAHLITSFIPSIFFGIPEASTIVATLPGHRMVLKGRGIAALKAVLLSAGFAALLAAALFHLSLDAFQIVYAMLKDNMKFIVLILSIVLIARTKKPHLSLLVFLLAGMLGYSSLSSGAYDPFLPLFSGMFAIGAILNYTKGKLPEQRDEKVGLSFLKYSFLGVLLGFLADLLPGISSPSQVATFAAIFMPMNTLGYLAALGSISVSEAIFTLSSSASIGKARMGATVWLSEFIDIEQNIVLLLSLFIISTAITVFVIYLLRKHVGRLASIDFSRMNIVLALYLVALSIALNGVEGLMIVLPASALGWVTIRMGVERTMLMGAVIIPTLLLLFRIFF